MSAPIISMVTLVAELVIAFLIFFIIYKGYNSGKIPYRLVIFALAYEVIFNIGYMLYRSIKPSASGLSKSLVKFAIFHGILSLLVFIFAVPFLIIAMKKYRKGENFFKKNKALTFLFVVFWTIALLSGLIVYISIYF